MLDYHFASQHGRQRHQEIIDGVARQRLAQRLIRANSRNKTLAGRIRSAVLSVLILIFG